MTTAQKIARIEGKLKRAVVRCESYRTKLRSLKSKKS